MSGATARPGIERVVLVGPTRSGTTLVQRLFCEHTGLTTFPETHVFRRGFRRGLTGWVVDRGALAHAMCEVHETVGGPATPTVQPDAPPGAAARAVVEWFDEIADSRGAIGWLEKTPAHFRRLGLIRVALGPSGVIVHVVRRPSDCIASRVRTSAEWGRPRGWLHSSAHWLGAFAAMQLGCRRFGDSSICFELLLLDPDGAIERVAAAVGLAPAPAGAHRDPAPDMAVDAEPWRHRSLEAPSGTGDVSRPGAPGVWPGVLLDALDALWKWTYARPLERRSRRHRRSGAVEGSGPPTCVVVTAHDPRATYGRPRVLRAHLTALRRLGYEVVELGTGGDAMYRWRPRSPRLLWGLGRWAIGGRRSLSAALTLSGRDERRAGRILREIQPDLIVVDGVRVMGAVPPELRGRAVVDLDDLLSDRYERAVRAETDVAWVSGSVPVLGRVSALVGDGAGRRALQREARILRDAEARAAEFGGRALCSPAEAAVLARRTGAPASVLGPGFDIDPAPPATMAAEPTFLLVGRWSYPPNRAALRWLLDDVLPLVVSSPTVHVIGAGLEHLAPRPGAAQVVIHGHVEDIEDAYASCWASLCPVWEPGGVKVKVVEALAHGRGCVVTSAVARGVLGGERGLVVCDDAAAFAAAIDVLAHDRAAAAGLAAEAAEHAARHYTEDALVARWGTVLAQLDVSGPRGWSGGGPRSYRRGQ